MFLLRPILAVFVAALLTSCIAPPKLENPLVLDNEEFELLDHIKRGKDYALSGQMDRAELQFRLALKKAPHLHSLYSDLGYVFKAQNRLDDAAAMFRRALELEPDNAVARDNLARTFYLGGDLEAAAREYEELVVWAHSVNMAELHPSMARQFTGAELVGVYRNLSSIYLSLGDIDESLCYSRLAVSYGGTESEVGRDIRLLLYLDRVNDALVLLRSAISARQDNIPVDFLLDYGLALYASGDYNTARQALNRVLSNAGADYSTQLSARFVLLAIAWHDRRKEDIDFFLAGIRSEEPAVCEKDLVNELEYWPLIVADDVRTILRKLCDDEVEPVSS